MIHKLRIESVQLAGNLLGDPSERDLFVYVPPGYEDTDRRYPTAYLLHAAGEGPGSLVDPPTDRKRWVPPLEDVVDPVFRRMGATPMIVVIPDGTTRYGCSQWVDSPVCGNFEQSVVHDVVSFVDERFRTIANSTGRGIFGFSSGGMGAWNIGSQNPDVFGALAMLSGDSYLDMTHKTLLYDYLNSIWPEPPAGPIDGNDYSSIVYAYSACYSPNPSNPPFYVDLPLSFPEGELLQDVWDRWLAFDPVINCATRTADLKKLRGILLDVGTADDYYLQWGHRLLSHRLGRAGINHQVNENTGNHGGRSRERFQVALLWLSQVLDTN